MKILILIFLNFLFLGCSNSDSTPTPPTPVFECNGTPVSKGLRQFGMDILDVPSVGSYSDSFASLKEIGGTFQTFHTTWNALEAGGSGATSGVFSDPGNALAALNALAVSDGIKVTLRIHPIDVPGKFVPSDLSSVRFNHANMQTRFQNLLNFVFTKISPANVTRLIVGNEADGFDPGSDTNFWLDYPAFLFNLNVWLNSNYPTIELGFTLTAAGATDTTKILASSSGQRSIDVLGDSGWAQSVDFVGITYYPLDSQFQLQSNNLVSTMFQNIVSFTNKTIHIEEIGYSSSNTNLGTESLQSEFFCEVLKAWDLHSSRIPSLAVLRMVDKSRADAESVATTYGLSGNENFIEYIRTLGVRTNDNQPKQAFNLLAEELEKRGF